MLTIGMMTHDDYHGVFFTISAIKMFHPEVKEFVRFVVVDNNPDSDHGKHTREFCAKIPEADYHTVRGTSSTSYRNIVFEVAPTDQVLCMDCHVLIWPQAIKRLIKWYQANPDLRHDLIHGPMIGERHEIIATHMEPCFRGWNFGIWGNNGKANDERADAFEIPMHGMGLFACSRQGWPRFSPGLRYFGAEEGTIHERFRRIGRRCWCLPFLRWLHRFGRPGGASYRNQPEDKVRNNLVAFRDAGLPIDICRDYFIRHLHGNDDERQKKMDKIMRWLDGLPPCPLPPAPPNYQPFLGHEIKVLD